MSDDMFVDFKGVLLLAFGKAVIMISMAVFLLSATESYECLHTNTLTTRYNVSIFAWILLVIPLWAGALLMVLSLNYMLKGD